MIYRIKTYLNRVKILTNRGWYWGMTGKLIHPHCMNYVTRTELFNMPNEEFIKL